MVYYSVDHPTDNTTMVEPATSTAAWLLGFQPPHPVSLSGRGWSRVGLKGLVSIYNLTKKKLITHLNDYILVLNSNQILMLPKVAIALRPRLPPGCTSSLYSPQSRAYVFGWLLYVKWSTSGRWKPLCILYNYFFVVQFATPNNFSVSPHVLPTQWPPLSHPPYRFRQLSDDCWDFLLDWRPPKAKALPSSLFLTGLALAP